MSTAVPVPPPDATPSAHGSSAQGSASGFGSGSGSGSGSTVSGRTPPPLLRWRHLLYAVGALLVLVGLRGILVDSVRTHPLNWAVFFLGVIVAHDLVLAPAVSASAVLLHRVPAAHRPLVHAGLVVTGLVTLVALPVVLGFGRRSDDASTLPLPYLRNLVIVLGAVWLVIALLAVLAARSRVRAAEARR